MDDGEDLHLVLEEALVNVSSASLSYQSTSEEVSMA